MPTRFSSLLIPSRHSAAFTLYTFCFLVCLFVVSACNVTKHLEKSQHPPLLAKNSIAIKSEKKLALDQRTPLLYELAGLYRQKPNERSMLALGSPARLWFYYRYKDRDSKFARWVMKKVAEPPTFFDEQLSVRTASNIQNYMRQRGYLSATTTYEARFYTKGLFKKHYHPRADSLDGKAQAEVAYTLELGPQYHIGKVDFVSQDSNILAILKQSARSSNLKTGAALDSRVFDAEKLRITAELKNRGYAFFIPNFVEFVGDSTNTLTDFTVEVLPQSDSTLHKTYIIGNIAVFTDLVPDLSTIRKDTTLNGIYFASTSPEFEVKPSRLLNAITLRQGMLYNQEELDKTSHNLNALGIFRFVSVRPLQDTLNPEQIDVTISFALNNRFSIGGDLIELNSSTNSSSSLSGRLLGLSSTLSATNRNLFSGAEKVQTNLAYSLEFDLSPKASSLIFSQEFRIQNELTIPRYFDYFGLWKRLNRWHLVKNAFYDRLRSDGQARLALNYNHLDLRRFYVYNLFNASFGYSVRSNAEHQYTFDHIGIDILPKPSFDSTFLQNEFLIRSSDDQLFTGFLFRSFTYTYASRANAYGERWFFRLNSDLSGLEVLAINKLWAIPFGQQNWQISGLDFSKYLRLDLTGSYTHEFNPNITAAARLGIGAAFTYGDTKSVPYVKQFYVGGPSSIRAWRIRELGPGGNPVNDSIQPFYQAADFRFEFSGELRFPLFWWVKGAVFLDGGNIWTLKPDPDRVDAQLKPDSYKNIALGTGFGLRFDFDYFVFRFDWGLKLRRPYTTKTEGHWVDWSGARWRDISNFNLAVGYPF